MDSLTANSFERIRSAAENVGLNWRETKAGVQASMQTPGHSSRDLGTSITYNGDQVLIHSHNGDTEDVLDALGLTWRDLYDNPRETSYSYADGREVLRRWRQEKQDMKGFTQRGNTTGSALYGIESLENDGPVYVVEGEKDVRTARAVWGAVVVSQAQGSNTAPSKADWTQLVGRDVIIVRDDDKPGHKRAEEVRSYLESLSPGPSSIQVVDVAAGKDLSDHAAAGHGPDELVPVPEEGQPRRRVSLVPASSVRTERLDWLIDNWVPRRSLTLLAGREGLGKSTIACGIAAQATRGELNAPPMNVAYLNTEDSRSITVKPRLQAAGADLDRMFFIDVTTETGNTGALSLPGDTSLLARALADKGVKLVILDAAKSAMHASLDGYRDDDVRQFLEPLAAMSDEHDMAVIGLVHFGKRESADTGKLILGSVAWSQIARSVLSVAVNDEGTLVCTNTKGNLAPAQISREAMIESVTVGTDDGKATEVGRIVWGEMTDVSAADLLVSRDDQDDDDRTEAEAWLEDFLTDNGATPRADVFKAAAKDRIASERTIKRAFKKLGGVSEASGFPRVSTWSLPAPSGVTVDPRAYMGGPTGPTGNDLQKQDGPTGLDSQLGHAQENGPTGDPTAGNDTTPLTAPSFALPKLTGDTDLEDMVIGSLHAEYPMGLKVVEQSVPPMFRDQVADTITTLTANGLVIQDARGRYLLNSTRKASA